MEKENLFFLDAREAQEFAKNNPGVVITRDGDRFIVLEGSQTNKRSTSITPDAILEHLNRFIISQERAKKEIAQTLYYHYLKYLYPDNKNIAYSEPFMFVGPTGSGKTYTVQKACEKIGMIFLHVNSVNMVPAGVKGYSLEDIGKELIDIADGDMKKLGSAVVFFDEVDKLLVSDDSELQYGARVTAAMLRLIEGGELKIYTNSQTITLDTSNMLFIFGGAFQSILDEKLLVRNTMGFLDNSQTKLSNEITLEDLYNYGVPKELLGRLGAIINLKLLTKEDYINILQNTHNSPLNEFVSKVEFHGSTVSIEKAVLEDIAQKALKSNLGVRGLRQLIKPLFEDILFEVANGVQKRYVITL